MKITINTTIDLQPNADDLKLLEDMLYRGGNRALVSMLKRVDLAQELMKALIRSVGPEAFVWEKPAAQATPPSPEPPLPEPPKLPEPPPPEPAAPEVRKFRRMRDVLKTVATRPEGFLTTDDAAKLIGHGSNAQNLKTMIGQWLLNGEVQGVIVANYTPPTKGCPGRVHIDKESLLNRRRQSEVNAQTGGTLALRKWREERRKANGAHA